MIKKEWVNAIWGILGVLMFSSGFASQNVVTMVVGLSLTLGNVSSHLTSHVKSDNRVKRALEVVFMVAALGVFGFGYIELKASYLD